MERPTFEVHWDPGEPPRWVLLMGGGSHTIELGSWGGWLSAPRRFLVDSARHKVGGVFVRSDRPSIAEFEVGGLPATLSLRFVRRAEGAFTIHTWWTYSLRVADQDYGSWVAEDEGGELKEWAFEPPGQ